MSRSDRFLRPTSLHLESLEVREVPATGLSPSSTPPIHTGDFIPVESLPSAILLNDPLYPAQKKLVVLPGTLPHPWGPVGGSVSLNNQAPDARADSFVTSTAQPFHMDLTRNDTDPEGDRLRVYYVTDPRYGQLYRDATSSALLYQPDRNFTGTDSFSYSVYDRLGNSDDAGVTVQVLPGTKQIALSAVADTASTHAGKSVSIHVLRNDSGNSLHLDSITSMPLSGTAVMQDQQIIYKPRPGFVGEDRFTYQIADRSGTTARAVVILHVTNATPMAKDDWASTASGKPVQLAILENDSDPDGDPLRLVTFTQSPSGTVRRVGNRLEFTPNSGFTGTATFRYLIGDPFGAFSQASVRVVVGNRPPVANTDSWSTNVNEYLTIAVLANDSDPDGDTLTLVAVSPTKTTGGEARIDPRNPRRVLYVPRPGYIGRDSFTYTISDGRGGKSTGTIEVLVE